MNFEYIDINKLNLLSNNPRSITTSNFEKLKKSIQNNPDYFEARPLIISDRTGELVVIAGNQRLKASQELGLKQVPCCILKNLTEEREKEIIIRDNVELGDWDYDLLGNEWETEDLQDWGVDIPAINETDFSEVEETEKKEEITNINNKNIKIIFHYKDNKEIIDIFLQEIMERHPELINMVEINE